MIGSLVEIRISYFHEENEDFESNTVGNGFTSCEFCMNNVVDSSEICDFGFDGNPICEWCYTS